VSDEDLYKREEDRQWRQRIDERLVALTTGEQVQNDRLDELEEELQTQDKILRGDPNEGLLEQVDEIAGHIRRINAILWPDAIGGSGLVNDVRQLSKREDRAIRESENRWKFWTAVVVAIVSLVGLLATNLDRLASYFAKASIHIGRPPAGHTSKTEAKPKAVKPRPRTRRVKIPVQSAAPPITEETIDDYPTEEELQQRRRRDGGHLE